jgi:hypothetical protein
MRRLKRGRVVQSYLTSEVTGQSGPSDSYFPDPLRDSKSEEYGKLTGRSDLWKPVIKQKVQATPEGQSRENGFVRNFQAACMIDHADGGHPVVRFERLDRRSKALEKARFSLRTVASKVEKRERKSGVNERPISGKNFDSR